MDYSILYEQKKCSAEELAALVKDGWHIGMDTAVSHAPTFLQALAERAANNEIYDVRVQSLLDVQSLSFCRFGKSSQPYYTAIIILL